jgi:LuxR family maltose regulon positive regulatory protein
MSRGDLDAALEQSALAVDLAADGGDLDRGSAHGIRGLVLWALGDLEQARATWEISLAALEKAGHLADVLGGSIAMGDILIALGRLRDAEAVYRRGLALGNAATPPLRGTADMHVGLADLLRETGDLTGARSQLATAEGLGEYAGLPQNRHRRRMALARLLLSEGDAASGIPLLEEAESLYTPDFFPEVRPIAAMRARQRIAAGQLAAARQELGRRSRGDGYLAEYDRISRVRLLLAERRADAARDEIDSLLASAEAGGRRGAVIELLILRALAGRGSAALDDLGRAVSLSDEEGYVRVFADEGPGMARLLGELAARDGDTPSLTRLREAASGPRRPAASTEGLSSRELEVLRLLASDLSGPEISRRLVVSLNTLRTHTKNIYAKLGAASRREAITRAVELGLLNSPR